jgi:hypothetical protein
MLHQLHHFVAILCVYVIIIACCCALALAYFAFPNERYTVNTSIPRIIWAYWQDTTVSNTSNVISPIVQKCIATWRKYNPDYTINIVNRQNLNTFIDVDIVGLKNNDSMTRESDFVRLHLLKKYGGIWLDASTICTRSLDWIIDTCNTKQCQFFGYYLSDWTTNDKFPILENWMFACVPRSNFVVNWCDEFMRINTFLTVDEYIASVRLDTDLQGLQIPNYLAMHAAAQRTLQHGSYTDLYIISATKDNGPLSYLSDSDWKTPKAINSLCGNNRYKSMPLIKMRGAERSYLESNVGQGSCLFDS